MCELTQPFSRFRFPRPKLTTTMVDDHDWDLDAIEVPIDGTLDLHTFRPGEVGDLIPDYLDACLDRGITNVRIVHGKGTGTLRRRVLAVLARCPQVAHVAAADERAGAWGATLVTLHARRDPPVRG